MTLSIAAEKILIVAGGTGGHLVPAQIMAHYFQDRQHKVACIGTDGALEQKLLSSFELHTLRVTGLRGKSTWASVQGVMRMVGAFGRSLALLRQLKPKVILCMGGYVTVPVALAARVLRIPVVLHEQNAVAGLSNRYLAKVATTVLAAFPGVLTDKRHVAVVGNPLRPELKLSKSAQAEGDAGSMKLLVLGGSQGAERLNTCCMQVCAAGLRGVEVWHQTGARDYARVSAHYQQQDALVRCSAFIDDMSAAYAWADVVVSRAGALSVTEIAAAGLPALFVPFPYAVDDHQYSNAMTLVGAGAASVCRESAFSDETFRQYIRQWQQHPAELKAVGAKAYALSIPDADAKIYDACMTACQLKEERSASSR